MMPQVFILFFFSSILHDGVPVHLILTYGKLFFTALPLILSGTEIRVHHTPCYKSVVQFSYTAVHDHLLIIACFGPFGSFAYIYSCYSNN